MIWHNLSNVVLNVRINNLHISSEKATDDLLGFPYVASQDFFHNILAF